MSALADQFRDHFGHRDHLYGVLLAELADDLDAGGVTAEICRDHLDAPRADATSLRLMAGLSRIVLRREAEDLEPFYDQAGPVPDPNTAWPLVLPVLAAHEPELRGALDHPPQTNEVGRSAVLAVGLFEAARRHGLARVRLLEPGASAGLNLHVDHYAFRGPGWSWGPADSPLAIDTQASGVQPGDVEIVERRGCDLSPVDASTPAGARWLTSFVWPFDRDRHGRLAAALRVVRHDPVTVDRAPAAEWVADQLAAIHGDDVLTVVWHSITQQYWPTAQSEGVAQAIEDARRRIPVAHHGPELSCDGDVVARSHHHGPPISVVHRSP